MGVYGKGGGTHIKNDNEYISAYAMKYTMRRSIFFYCDPREMAPTRSDTGVPLADLTAPNWESTNSACKISYPFTTFPLSPLTFILCGHSFSRQDVACYEGKN